MRKLVDIVADLTELEDDGTIYVVEPWSEDSLALVAIEPESGGLPEAAVRAGMSYFLEVSVAREFIEDLRTSGAGAHISTCARLLEYALNDA
jgi:hypothetical protein